VDVREADEYAREHIDGGRLHPLSRQAATASIAPEGGEALCLHNAATGREATLPHVIARSAGPARKVVVVGAGPAGFEAARVAAGLYDECARAFVEHVVDQVVVEHGTLPADELYLELKPASSNRGEVDLDALLAGRPENKVDNADGRLQLFRVGDVVASRNIHAAIYDSLRLCKDL
jgi:hypothetical protein